MPTLDDMARQAAPQPGADRPLMHAVAPLFALASMFCVFRHEMWRDEIESWNTVLRSRSLTDLFEQIRYTGHGALWYLTLYPLVRLTSNPLAMQILHVAVASLAAAAILAFFPSSRLCRTLIVFGYFPFFEYATITRNYGLSFLLVVVFCVVVNRQPDATLLPVAILVLLAQTHAYGVILAVSLAAFLLVRHAERPTWRKTSRKEIAIAAVLFFAGLAVGVRQLIPPTQDTPFGGWLFAPSKSRLLSALSTPWRGLVPIPRPQHHFWNTNFLDVGMVGSAFRASLLEGVLSVALCLLLILLVARRRAPLIFVVLAFSGLLLFTYVKFVGDVRHHGHYWVAFLAALWLWTGSAESPLRPHGLDRAVATVQGGRAPILLMLSLIAAVAGSASNAADVLHTFSASVAAARYVSKNLSSDTPVVGDRNYLAGAVAMHLNRPFFYPMGNRWATRVVWDEAGTRAVDPDTVARAVDDIGERTKRDVLVILSYPAAGPLAAYQPIATFSAGIVPDERYFLYVARFRP